MIVSYYKLTNTHTYYTLYYYLPALGMVWPTNKTVKFSDSQSSVQCALCKCDCNCNSTVDDLGFGFGCRHSAVLFDLHTSAKCSNNSSDNLQDALQIQ